MWLPDDKKLCFSPRFPTLQVMRKTVMILRERTRNSLRLTEVNLFQELGRTNVALETVRLMG